MPVITAFSEATRDISALSLSRYAQIIRYSENAFFGINAPDNRERACRKIWTKLERDMVARYLGEAQASIEQILAYPIGQTWYEDEEHHNTNPHSFYTRWARTRTLGVRAVSVVAATVALNHTSDPATIAATPTSVTNENEIHFYQAGTDVEVWPSELSLTGGNVTASFPRARLVITTFQDNPDTGLEYADTSPSGPFAQAVDIKRIYTDATDVGEFVFPLGESGCQICGESTIAACGYIHHKTGGVVTFLRADSGVCQCGRRATDLRINYCAGQPLDALAEDAILHLAHALMPIPPCPGCDPITMLWKQDQNTPEVLTRARIDCPFGVHDGAWRAWTYATKNKHFRMPLL